MSIADHFEQAPDSRFIRDYDAGTARRQLNLSIILVAVIALAATALGVVVRFDLPSTPAMDAPHTVSLPPTYAGKL